MTVTYIAAVLATTLLATAARTAAEVWPKPASVSRGQDTATVIFSKEFFKLTKESPIIESAFVRYRDITFPHVQSTSANIRGDTTVQVQSLLVDFREDEAADEYPHLGVNESYTLSVSSTGDAAISAQTVWGALRGIETFSQLVEFDFNSETYEINAVHASNSKFVPPPEITPKNIHNSHFEPPK